MNLLKKLLVSYQRATLLSRSPAKSLCSINSCESVNEIEEEDNLTNKKESHFCQAAEQPPPGGSKVTIIGSGRVGVACAFGILTKKICNEICFLSRNTERMIGEALDLQHASVFLNDATIRASTDYHMSADSQIAIITAGRGRKKGESQLSVTKTNIDLIKNIVPRFVKTSPNSILIIVTNPVDILTYVAWKSSGFPKNRVIGSGANLDMSRFKFFLSHRSGVTTNSCKTKAIGEHEDSLVPVLSEVEVGRDHLSSVNPYIGDLRNGNDFHTIGKEIATAGMEGIKWKGYKNWAVALSCATITEAILRNYDTIMPVSTCVQGLYCIDKEVCLSVPCIINSNGATAIPQQELTDLEIERLRASAEMVYKAQSGLQLAS